MANNEDDFEEMYTSDSEKTESSRRQMKEAAKAAYNASKKYGKKAVNFGAKIASRGILTVLPYIVPIIIFILAVISLLTIMVYIFSGPDMLWGQIDKLSDELFTAILEVINGGEYAAIDEKQVVDVANYIQNMGYDLVGYGFINQLENNSNTFQKDESGRITKIKSQIISDYLAAENRTYMLSSVSLRSIWTGALGFLDGNDAATMSSGMINVSNDIDAVTKIIIDGKEENYDVVAKGDSNGHGGIPVELNREIEVDRATKKMTITLKENRLVNGQKKTTETKCVYNLEGWAGRYGKPYEFLLALHLGTMAPSFADTIATAPEFDARVNMRLFKSVEIVRLKYKGKDLETLEKELNERIDTWWAYYSQLNANPNSKIKYSYQDAVNQAQNEVGVTKTEISEAKAYEEEHSKQRYTPYIVNVENHWYKDITFKDLTTASEDDAYVKTEPDAPKQSKYNKFDVYTYSSGEIYQVAEPKKSDINQKFDELFTNKDWTKVTGTSSQPYSETKSKIAADGLDMQVVATMLEKAAQKSDDAKYVIRDLKEYLEIKGFKFKDSRILTSVGEGEENTDSSLSSSSGNSSTSGSTTNGDNILSNRLAGLLGGKTAPVIYESTYATIKASEISEGTKVQSIVSGTVKEISENAVQIEITTPSSLKGKTLIMSGVKMDTAIQKGAVVSNNSPIATTKGKDIKIQLQDENKKLISVKDNL